VGEVTGLGAGRGAVSPRPPGWAWGDLRGVKGTLRDSGADAGLDWPVQAGDGSGGRLRVLALRPLTPLAGWVPCWKALLLDVASLVASMNSRPRRRCGLRLWVGRSLTAGRE
jgi:hypothetical protein